MINHIKRIKNQAGVSDLYNFEAVFTATITIDKPREESFTVVANDGWILSLGPDSSGHQPYYLSGPMVNAPPSGKRPFYSYPVMGAINQLESPATSIVTVIFPTSGTYPIEMDYTEAAGGQLMLTLIYWLIYG